MIRTSYKEHLPLLLLLGVASGVWLTVCRYGFLNYDDGMHVYENYFVQNPTAENFSYVWQTVVEAMYIPVTYSAWMLLSKLSLLWPDPDGWPLNPRLYHTANFLCHLGSCTILYLLLKRMVVDRWAALGGAFLFALHPLQVEAVAWVTGLKDTLSGFWVMVCLYSYLRQVEVRANPRRRWGYYGLATLAFFLALLSKPGAASLPFVVAIVGGFILRRPWRQVGLELLPWLLGIIPVFLMTIVPQSAMTYRFIPVWWQRFLVAGDALSFYLFKLLFPFPLASDYGRAPEFVLSHSWSYLTGLIPYVGLGWLLWRYRRPWLYAFFLLPAVALLPTLGWQSFAHQVISTVADRYLYFGMVGPALGVGWLLARSRKWPGWYLYGGMVCLWLLLTSNQLRYWRDSFVFNEHILAVNPSSWVANNNMGEALAKEGRYAEAVPYFAKVVEFYPEHYRAYWNKGMALEYLGQGEEALALYQTAIRIQPNFAEGYNSIGALYLERGELLAATSYFLESLRLRPEMIEVHGNLATAYLLQQKYPEAEEEFLILLAANPNSFLAEHGLAEVLRAKGQVVEAVWHYRQALAINPSFARAYNSLGEVLLGQGALREAESEFRQALGLAPTLPGLYLNLGRVLLAEEKVDEAIHFLQLALQQQPGQPEAMEVFRAALTRKEASASGP